MAEVNPVTVEVEYCGGWGYGPRYEELARLVRQKVPGAVVTGTVGRTSSFEVKINSVLIFSKLEKGSFPDFEETVASVEAASVGEKPKMVEKLQPSKCTIL